MSKKIAFKLRQWHKWLSLAIGGQVLLWLASGVYMVVVDLDFIHGDHLVTNMTEIIEAGDEPAVTFAEIVSEYPDATSITLANWVGRPVYRVTSDEGLKLVDAAGSTLEEHLAVCT